MIAPLLRTAITTGSLLLAPAPESAGSEADGEGVDAPAEAAAPEPEPGPEPEPEPETSEAPEAESEEDGPTPEDEPDTSAADLGAAGVAGQLIDKDDPNAGRATADLEGEALGTASSDVPDRLRPLQAGAWWSLFITTGLATTGGVFAGLAERQEDEAIRVTQLIDLSTGSSYEYADISDDYERMLDRGDKLSWAARGFFIASAATAVTSLTLFVLDRRQRKTDRRVSFGAGSASVRF